MVELYVYYPPVVCFIPVPSSPYSLCGRKPTFAVTELRGCVKVEVAVLGSRSLTVIVDSVDIKNTEEVSAQSSGTV